MSINGGWRQSRLGVTEKARPATGGFGETLMSSLGQAGEGALSIPYTSDTPSSLVFDSLESPRAEP